MLQGPIYDPKSKIRKFKMDEDVETIRFNLSKTGELYKDPNFYFFLGDLQEWRRPKDICNTPKFIKGKPERFDALQGRLGDCWLVAAIEALTLHEHLIEHVVPPDQSFDRDYVGAFHFRIWQLGTWYDVVVDDRLPVFKVSNKPCNARSISGDVFWACLLEKAYAKVHGKSYENLEGGFATTAFQDFTGGIIEEFFLPEPPPGLTVKWFMNQVHSNDALMVVSTSSDVDGKRPDIQARHGYSITGVIKCPDHDPDYPGLFLVRLMNPGVIPEWKGKWSDSRLKEIDEKIRKKMNIVAREDGEFWIGETDFVQFFLLLQICHLGPGQYVNSRKEINVGTWKTLVFWGEWVKGISAGGSSPSTRHKNPQYRILLDKNENDLDRDGFCLVVIELTQKSKHDIRLVRDMAFFIYSLSNIPNPPIPLDYDFFQNNKALNEDSISKPLDNQRSFVMREKLEPGKYCIVPCTLMEDEEQTFLLRVFSESRVDAWEYDTQISKSLPNELETSSNDVKNLERVFFLVSGGKSEVDWLDLKDILEQMMNTKNSFLSRITQFLTLVMSAFETFFSFRLSNNNQTGDTGFTKEDYRSMIAMLDMDHSGKLNVFEFRELWNKICFWVEVYSHFSDDSKCNMPILHLRDALGSIGFNVNRRIMHILIHRYANNEGNISLTDFILCGVKLEIGLLQYQEKTAKMESSLRFTLEEWVKAALQL